VVMRHALKSKESGRNASAAGLRLGSLQGCGKGEVNVRSGGKGEGNGADKGWKCIGESTVKEGECGIKSAIAYTDAAEYMFEWKLVTT